MILNVVYGHLRFDEANSEPFSPQVHAFNAAFITAFRQVDAEPPFLTRTMFRIVPQLGEHELAAGPQMIRFATDLKREPREVADRWIAKLEEMVLPRLAWRSARITIAIDAVPAQVLEYAAESSSLADLLRAVDRGGDVRSTPLRWTRTAVPMPEWGAD